MNTCYRIDYLLKAFYYKPEIILYFNGAIRAIKPKKYSPVVINIHIS